MVSVSQVQVGVVKYIDDEILSKIQGWEKWVLGAGAGIAARRTVNIFNALKSSNVVKMLGIIDENDMIDIDLLHEEFAKQAKDKGAITFNVPLIGALTLNASDVEKLYSYIVNAEKDVF